MLVEVQDTTKFPYDLISVRRTYFTVKFPYGEISVRRNVKVVFVLTFEFFTHFAASTRIIHSYITFLYHVLRVRYV